MFNAIYGVDFLGFSYGFRSGHSLHQALDRVNWVLDADFCSFFDAFNHLKKT